MLMNDAQHGATTACLLLPLLVFFPLLLPLPLPLLLLLPLPPL